MNDKQKLETLILYNLVYVLLWTQCFHSTSTRSNYGGTCMFDLDHTSQALIEMSHNFHNIQCHTGLNVPTSCSKAINKWCNCMRRFMHLDLLNNSAWDVFGNERSLYN